MRTRSVFVITGIVIVAMHLTAMSAFCEEQQPVGRKNSLKGGAWAIQFQITDDLGLKPFNGMTVSLKRHFTSHSALRLGANLNLRYEDQNRDHVATQDTLLYTTRYMETDDSYGIKLDLMYLNYPNAGATVNWYWGAGPLVAYSRSHRVYETVSDYVDKRITGVDDTKGRSWRVGALGALGVEWFATKGIGFHAEYRAAVSYGKSKAESSSVRSDTLRYQNTDNSHSWDIDGVQVILGVSLYF